MKNIQFIISTLLVLGLFSACKKKCDLEDFECEQKQLVEVDCNCVCPQNNLTLNYTSPFDGKYICQSFTPNTILGEYYVHDNYSFNSFSCNRILEVFEVAFVDYKYGNDVPYGSFDQGIISSIFSPGPVFYCKDEKRDTLFMDDVWGFWPFNEFWLCDDNTLFSGYAIRTDTALDWKLDLYYQKSVYEIGIDKVAPDTTVHIHMPRLL
ncbi:MAG: hypothetical protein KA479_10090 [Saprospiraceae bacterium]|nr:hypothetical protein [Saprospiraceae bacterium]